MGIRNFLQKLSCLIIMINSLDKLQLFGIDITNTIKSQILEYLLKNLKNKADPYYIVTPNPEIIVYATKHPHFKKIINNARIALPDGVGVILAGLILGKRFKQRITGVDFMELLCAAVAQHNLISHEKPIAIGFLGGRKGVAEMTAKCLVRKYPELKVVFAGEDPDKLLKSLRLPRSPMIDILFVAFGFPKQEEWMAAMLGKIPVRVMMGVGGAFDYISGNVKRAPFIIRLFGFEWLYRLIRQPWRIRRQFSLIQFVFLLLKERLKH